MTQMNLNKSKYKDVSYSDLKTSAQSALNDVNSLSSKLVSSLDVIKNPSIIPNGVGSVLTTSLNLVLEPTTGTGSIGALKKYLNSLIVIANEIGKAQEMWNKFELLLEEIKEEKAKKGSDDYRRDYYNSLITKRNEMIITLASMEAKIDELIKKIV
jgi:hypothetical protein